MAGPRRQHDLGLGRGDPSISPAPAGGGGHAPSRGGGQHTSTPPPPGGRCTAQNLITILITTQHCPHTIHTCHHVHVSTATRVTICSAPTLGCLTSAARGLAPPCQRGSGLRAEIEKLSAAGCGVAGAGAGAAAVTGPQQPRATISCRCPLLCAPPQPAASSRLIFQI